MVQAGGRDERVASRWITVGGLRLHTLAADGIAPAGAPTVVLLSGLIVSSAHALPSARRLAGACRVLAPDLPGYGPSDRPPRALDVRGLSDALAGWTREIGLDRAVFVGASFGAQVVADFAARHPERVSQIVLAAPTLDRARWPVARQVWRWLRGATREPPLTRTMLRDYRSAGIAAALARARFAVRDRIEDKLPGIHAPTLVVCGGRDPVSPRRWCEHLAGLLPHGRLVVLPGAGHSIVHRHAEAFTEAVLPFIMTAGETGAMGHAR